MRTRKYLKMGDELLKKVEEQAKDMILNADEEVALYYYRDVYWGTQTQYIGVQIIGIYDGTNYFNQSWNLEDEYDLDVFNDLVREYVDLAKDMEFCRCDEYDDYTGFIEYEEDIDEDDDFYDY
jgi:hypothetical protein